MPGIKAQACAIPMQNTMNNVNCFIERSFTKYVDAKNNPVMISIEITISGDLNDDSINSLKNNPVQIMGHVAMIK